MDGALDGTEDEGGGVGDNANAKDGAGEGDADGK